MDSHLSHFARVLSLSAFGLFMTVAPGCGNRAATVETPTDNSKTVKGTELDNGSARNADGSVAASPCTSATSCPPANMDVSSLGFEEGAGAVLRGYIGQAVPWNFKGVDLNGRGRRVGVLLNNVPGGSTISPEQTGKDIVQEAKIDWTPDKKQASDNDIEVILRDIDRCEMMNADNKKKCSANKKLDDFDKVVSLPWAIDDKASPTAGGTDPNQNVVKISDPNCGLNGATSDSDITNKVVQSVIGVATGGGIAGLIPGLLSSILNKQTSAKPTEC